MISEKDVWAILEAEATKLKSLTFDELDKINSELPGSDDSGWRKWQEVVVGGQRLHMDVLMSKWRGLFRQRISVELVGYTDDGALSPAIVRFLYFERLKSGRLLYG